MANGIMQRFRGKVQAAGLFLGVSPQYGPGTRVAYSTAGTQTMGLEGISAINASSAISIWQMGLSPTPGLRHTIQFTAISSAAFVKAVAGVSFDESTNTVFKSTYVQRVSLLGMTTLKWSITDVYPDTTAGGAPVGGLTLSTTT